MEAVAAFGNQTTTFSLPSLLSSSAFVCFYVLSALIALVVARVFFVLSWTGKSPWQGSRWRRRAANETVRTLFVLGSGGHTAEMLSLIKVLDFDRYQPRWYIAGATDSLSLSKAAVLEEQKTFRLGGGTAESLEAERGWPRKFDTHDDKDNDGGNKTLRTVLPSSSSSEGNEKASKNKMKDSKAYYLKVYRSREVGQSYATSIGTTLFACAHAAFLIFRIRPDVIICNGPGTCLPVCVAGLLMKIMGVRWVTMVFVESVCRVQKLSLTGMLFYKFRFMDRFYVQWESLLEKYPGTIFAGRVM